MRDNISIYTGRCGVAEPWRRSSCLLAVFFAVILLGMVRPESVSASDDVLSYGMTPIYGQDIHDGTYEIDGDSSSMFFKLRDISLEAREGALQAPFSIYSLSYLYVYMGTAEEAEAADEREWIRRDEGREEERHSVFTIPVTALNARINCAAYSVRRDKWYDRQIVLDAGSLPAEAADFTLPDYTLIRRAVRYYVAQGKADDPMEKEAEDLPFDEDEREAAMKVLAIAVVIIAVGGLLNYLLKRRART